MSLSFRHWAGSRWLVALACAILVSACTTTYDGPFEYVRGTATSESSANDLVARRATIDEVIGGMGTPDRKEASSDHISEILVYESVKRRTSFERTMGIKHSVTSQDVIEDRIFTFQDGRLIETHVTIGVDAK